LSAAGDAILHPIAIASVAVLLINDHFLKAAYPGAITGKLSDVAGLVFFPLLLVGVWEVALLVAGRWRGPRVAPLGLAVAATAVGFALVKTTAPGAEAFGLILGIGQWLPTAAVAAATARPLGSPVPPAIAVDPSDLIALPALAIPLAIGVTRTWPKNVQTSGSRRRRPPRSRRD
jgi:hypothetical protein